MYNLLDCIIMMMFIIIRFLYFCRLAPQAETRPNLALAIRGLIQDEDQAILSVNDKALNAPVRVLLKYGNNMAA